MPNITSNTTTYSYNPEELKKFFAKEHNVPEECINVRYVIQEVGGDPMDRYPGTNTVTSIEVTVDNKKARMQNSEWGKLDR